MREEEDNLCCLVLSAKVPCRVALIGHSSPPGILHALVQPEQLYVCVCVCGMWCTQITHGCVYKDMYTKSKIFLSTPFSFQSSSSLSKNAVYNSMDLHCRLVHVGKLWYISDMWEDPHNFTQINTSLDGSPTRVNFLQALETIQF